MNILIGMMIATTCQAPGEKLKAAVEATQKAGSVTYTFELHTRIPHSDPLDAKGRGVALSPKTLLMEVTGTGGIDKKIVATEQGTLLWHAFLGDWVTDVEIGDKGAGHGFQNPHDLLEVILPRCGRAAADGEALVLRFEGSDAVEVLGKLNVDARRLNPEGTWMELSAKLTEGRLQSVRSTAHINFAAVPGAGAAPDSFEYDAVVTIEAYDRDQRLGWKGADVEAALKRLKKVRSK